MTLYWICMNILSFNFMTDMLYLLELHKEENNLFTYVRQVSCMYIIRSQAEYS